MKNRVLSLLFLIIIIFSTAAIAQEKTTQPQTKYVPVTAYDPKRDAASDIQDALAEADRTGKRVLLEVGGQWCGWCHTMDRFFEENPSLLELREQYFIMVKINYSPENQNTEALSKYPTIPGYPHLFVLDSNGKLLHSQDTSKLESGRSYDLDRFVLFLKKWGPNSTARPASHR